MLLIGGRGRNSALTGCMRFAFNGIEDLRPLVRYMSETEIDKLVAGLNVAHLC